jgi:hypothetical protein
LAFSGCGGGAGGGEEVSGTGTFGDFAYQFWTGGSGGSRVTITGYTGSGGNVAIPAVINGMTVTAIGDWAFQNKSLTDVIIPAGVTSIGVLAFLSNSFTNITLPSALKSIGIMAFADSGLTTVTIPAGVTFLSANDPKGRMEIDGGAFYRRDPFPPPVFRGILKKWTSPLSSTLPLLNTA